MERKKKQADKKNELKRAEGLWLGLKGCILRAVVTLQRWIKRNWIESFKARCG